MKLDKKASFTKTKRKKRKTAWTNKEIDRFAKTSK
jgi:hypothetical protein